MKKTIATLLVGLPLAQVSSAAILFADTFDRSDSRNIDGSVSGITNNTGSALGVDGTYTHAHIDPNSAPPTYGVQDGDPANGGGAQIISNTLQLAVNAGTSNAFVNHNFTNSIIPSWGGFAVTVDVTGYNQSTTGQGGGFGVGMSQARALSAGDAANGASKMQDGIVDGTFNSATSVSIADFWVLLRGNGSLIWGGRGNAITNSATDSEAFFGSATVGAKTGTISVEFTNVSNFETGTSVDYTIYFNGGAVTGGTGSFEWSEDNANFIGLDARDNTGVGFDNFIVEAIPEPSGALLGLLGVAGLLRRRR